MFTKIWIPICLKSEIDVQSTFLGEVQTKAKKHHQQCSGSCDCAGLGNRPWTSNRAGQKWREHLAIAEFGAEKNFTHRKTKIRECVLAREEASLQKFGSESI